MFVEMERPYCTCLEVFRINDIEADIEDFGECYDDDKYSAPDYGCGNMRFHRYDEPSLEVLNKYNINTIEWETICDQLDNKLYWGRCALCE